MSKRNQSVVFNVKNVTINIGGESQGFDLASLVPLFVGITRVSHDKPETTQEHPQEATSEAAGATQAPASTIDILMRELSGQYALRTVDGLLEKTGLGGLSAIEDELDAAGIEYVVKTRRSDGAQLIGLASRN